jgi:hypothetical protein
VKRSAALMSLSRDHHQALVVARALRRADAVGGADARRWFLRYWTEHGEAHFRLEEDILLPGYVRYGNARHPLVRRVLVDHVAIRVGAECLAADPDAGCDTLRELGQRLADHVRMEERELFPMIEAAMPPEELTALARRLEDADGG